MKTIFSLFALCLPAIVLYGQFFWSPIVFDDIYFFDGSVHEQYLGKLFSFDLRWLPYATFEWTHALFGLDLIWFRLGNLALHLVTTVILFLFLRRLFERILHVNGENTEALPLHWLAFFGALIFALHPVSVLCGCLFSPAFHFDGNVVCLVNLAFVSRRFNSRKLSLAAGFCRYIFFLRCFRKNTPLSFLRYPWYCCC
ncbi:MAG: hypothetical protein ACXV79_15735 [Methylobacter sp.]